MCHGESGSAGAEAHSRRYSRFRDVRLSCSSLCQICGEIPGIKGDVDLDIAYEDPTAWSQPAVDPGVIYTVSVADAWTKELAEIARQQFAARGIVGVVHKVKILE